LSSSVNVGCGPAEERLLLTGLHAVADIYCENCHTTLGWKYVRSLRVSHRNTAVHVATIPYIFYQLASPQTYHVHFPTPCRSRRLS